MRRFDYSFIKTMGISTGTVTLMNKMELLRSRENERKKDSEEVFSALRSLARVQSVKGSNAIEGIITTDERIKKIVNENSAPLNHDEEEITGYRDVLDLILNNTDRYDVGENDILDMHRIMLSRTRSGGGSYKKGDNLIISENADGEREVIFTPVSSKETPHSMEQLILAYKDASGDSNIDPILLIPCFILDFLCVHPFSDGNGRVSRLLSLLMMFKCGIDVGKYISFEGQINKYKGNYYRALRRSSENWHSGDNDYIPFIENFIFTLHSCYSELDKRFDVLEGKRISKSNRIEAAVMNCFGSISKKEIGELLPDISITTIEKKLSDMLKKGEIKKIGTYTDARYARNK